MYMNTYRNWKPMGLWI